MIRSQYHRPIRLFITLTAVIMVLATTAVTAAARQQGGAAAQTTDSAIGEVRGTSLTTSLEGLEYVPGQVVVKVMAGKLVNVKKINRKYGLTTIEPLSEQLGVVLMEIPEGESVEHMLELLSSEICVEWAIPNFIAEPPVATPKDEFGWSEEPDPWEYDNQPALIRLALSPSLHTDLHVHDVSRGDGVRVFVLDTGLYAEHPRLQTVVSDLGSWFTLDLIDGDYDPDDEFAGIDNDGDGFVDEAAGHGTFVTGVVHLMAPDAKVVPMRVLDPEGYGQEFVVAEAITKSVRRGADVINISMTTDYDTPLLRDALAYAHANDVLVIASGGNVPTNSPNYPAADPCTMAVASVGDDLRKSTWSSFGDWIDVVAPGEEVVSTFADPSGSTEPVANYVRWAGTSVAAPFVAGQAALIRSVRPDLSAREVAAAIAQTARSVDSSNPDYIGALGSGIPDVYASVQWLAGGGAPVLGSEAADPLEFCH